MQSWSLAAFIMGNASEGWVHSVSAPHNKHITVQKIDRPTALARGFSVSDAGIVRRKIIGSANINNFYMLHIHPGEVVYGGIDELLTHLSSIELPDSDSIFLFGLASGAESDTSGTIATGLMRARYRVGADRVFIHDIVLVPRFVDKYATSSQFEFTCDKMTVTIEPYVALSSHFWNPPHPHLDVTRFCIGSGALQNVDTLFRAHMYKSLVIYVLDNISVHNLRGAYSLIKSQSAAPLFRKL